MLFFQSYCPSQILALKTCNQNISKTIIASSFKLGQLIEDDEKITIVFLSFCPSQILAIKTCNQDIEKNIIASSFKRGQLN